MTKVFTLALIILLALVSLASYLILTEKISTGEKQIADGQKKLEKKQQALEEGKTKLVSGKRELSEGKKEYEKAKDNLFMVFADKLLKGGNGFRDARKRIAEGENKVAKGEEKIDISEKRLDEKELKLRRGREQLRLAKGVRIACALGAVFFGSFSIVLGFRWRRSLARIIMHTDT